MTWKRGFAISILVLAFGSARVGVLAQDTPPEPPTPTPETETPPPAPATTSDESTKPSFWGDHLALYIEGGGGMGSADRLDSSVETEAAHQATSGTDLTDVLSARVAVGWKLPLDRGSFRIVLTANSEDSYDFHGVGLNRAVVGTSVQPSGLQPWWDVSISNGTLTSTQTPPTWTDADGDNFPDQDEIRYVPGSSPPSAIRTVPDNAQNRVQSWDFLFLRDFGGKTWSGNYSCGIRHLVYDGNIPAAAWLNVSDASNAAGGFTDGTNLRLLALNQETTGTGPTGSLGLQWHLFRNRLVFFAEARFAFLLQDMEVDSGNFFTAVTLDREQPQFTQTIPARLNQKVSKSTWNFGGAFGARFRVVDAFHVDLTMDRTAYQDSVLLPFAITIPSNAQQAPFGTVALYRTQDLIVDSIRVTLGFQF